MKICQQHWDELKAAIVAKGLGDFISTSPDDLMEKTAKATAEQQVTPATFDPLIAACSMITSNALQAGGIYLLGQKPDGTGGYCPLCEAELHGCHDWIESAVNGVAEFINNGCRATDEQTDTRGDAEAHGSEHDDTRGEGSEDRQGSGPQSGDGA